MNFNELKVAWQTCFNFIEAIFNHEAIKRRKKIRDIKPDSKKYKISAPSDLLRFTECYWSIGILKKKSRQWQLEMNWLKNTALISIANIPLPLVAITRLGINYLLNSPVYFRHNIDCNNWMMVSCYFMFLKTLATGFKVHRKCFYKNHYYVFLRLYVCSRKIFTCF